MIHDFYLLHVHPISKAAAHPISKLPVPFWFIVLISFFWHVIFSSILSLFALWGSRLNKTFPIKYMHVFIAELIIGALGIIPFFLSFHMKDPFGKNTIIISYCFALAVGLVTGVLISVKTSKTNLIN